MIKKKIKRFAIQPEDGGHTLYFLNKYGFVAPLGKFPNYGAALWFLHDVDGAELMSFERLCAVAVGVQSCLEEWGVSYGL